MAWQLAICSLIIQVVRSLNMRQLMGRRGQTVQQNGYTAGEFTSINLSDDGRITANYSNGRTYSQLQAVALATFASDNNLAKTDGGAFRETAASGSPNFSALGSIVSGSIGVFEYGYRR